MELVKNIFFNTDKLTQNSTIKISYVGKFFDDNCEKVFIHYGFGLLWEDVNEIEMEKTELGFQAEIDLPNKDTFNFCFKNENDEWDNNDNTNYIFELESENLDLVNVNEVSTELSTPSEAIERFRRFSKKVKLALYKIITGLPKLVSGKYKKKITE